MAKKKELRVTERLMVEVNNELVEKAYGEGFASKAEVLMFEICKKFVSHFDKVDEVTLKIGG